MATAPTSSEVVKTTPGGALFSQFSVADGVPIWMDADAEGDVPVLKVGSKLAPGSSVITVFKASGTSTSTPSGSGPVRRLYFSGTDLYGLRASGSFSKLGASGGFSWNLGSLDQPLLIDGTAAGIFVVVEAAKGRLHVINLQTGSTSDVPLNAAEVTSAIAKTNRHNDAARAAAKRSRDLAIPAIAMTPEGKLLAIVTGTPPDRIPLLEFSLNGANTRKTFLQLPNAYGGMYPSYIQAVGEKLYAIDTNGTMAVYTPENSANLKGFSQAGQIHSAAIVPRSISFARSQR